MEPGISSLFAGARFFGKLPLYLLRRFSKQEALGGIAAGIEQRDERFLERLRRDVYHYPESVYATLLRQAGCEYGDIVSRVRSQGTEAALRELFRAGVYLTVDEFKGRAPIVRGSFTTQAGPEDLRSPRASYHLRAASSGSRSSGTPVLFDLRFVRDCAANLAANLWARGGADWVKADWETPGGGARFRLIKFAAFGDVPDAWFSQMDPDDPLLPATARWNTQAMRLGGALVGRPLPAPIYAPLSDPTPVVSWAASVLRSGRPPFVFTFPSSAVRACLAAVEKGVAIAGTQFLISGEPITEACIATIRAAGCEPLPRYGSMEVGAIGYACCHPERSDDLHLLQNMHGLIQAGPDGAAAGLPESALLITSLHPRSPFLMLNASMGDEATLKDRDCGCPLQAIGWRPHISGIRSYEKLTTLGVTFSPEEIIPILEQILPQRFGGAPTSYQLLECESDDGQPQLELRVDPVLGPIDDEEILQEFCSAVEQVSRPSAQRIRLWRDAKTLRVVRKPAVASRAGKILHIHRMRSAP